MASCVLQVVMGWFKKFQPYFTMPEISTLSALRGLGSIGVIQADKHYGLLATLALVVRCFDGLIVIWVRPHFRSLVWTVRETCLSYCKLFSSTAPNSQKDDKQKKIECQHDLPDLGLLR